MNTTVSTMKIEKIIYDNHNSNVYISGEVTKNHLSFKSEMFISFNDLNVILNQLQQQNNDVNVVDLFKEEEINYNYFQYSLNAESLNNQQVDLISLTFKNMQKMIRA